MINSQSSTVWESLQIISSGTTMAGSGKIHAPNHTPLRDSREGICLSEAQ
ncbi:Bloom syndrome protein -like protein [Caligus rogercresseyi]|uniref:Bloom syndrome protein -like protein n=1 Tax=Caligus rogercresseyi TaxID=217165 RepID=A0A7T8GS55_CALRO|nr:Bloom syndrome protein -like protein [Caligus rogercresseyi]